MVSMKFAHVFKILHSVVHLLTYGLILSHLQLWSNKAIFNSEVVGGWVGGVGWDNVGRTCSSFFY
jgi:hypothetical protein